MNDTTLKMDEVRNQVRNHYSGILTRQKVASNSAGCCGPQAPAAASQRMGYSENETSAVPEGANLGLGCGNPAAIASLKVGQTVLDLGSGAGFDCFLSAAAVGSTGHVIGVDMTPEMVSKARANAVKGGYQHAEFRLGEIENLPAADSSVDVIISNCVVNLSPDKGRVFKESYRVLRKGGRLAISDVVAFAPIPSELLADSAAHCACVSGAVTRGELRELLEKAGFAEIRITSMDESRNFIRDWVPGARVEDFIVSATIEAVKP